MQGPQAAILGAGDRLHLHHGPIDLIIGADAEKPGARQVAFEAAHQRFQTILEGLVEGLVQHRSQLTPRTPAPADPVAQRMYQAAGPSCEQSFVTPMIAVAGAVADEILAAMCSAVPLQRAYVNNGGDIAVHLSEDTEYLVAMAQVDGSDLGRIRFTSADGIRGIATSGRLGRSHSLGVADSVTVLAATAAQADVAATLIANAVDLPDCPDIIREPASDLSPDSDLGARLVVTGVPLLKAADCKAALEAGHTQAQSMLFLDQIKGAALFLQGQNITVGQGFSQSQYITELEDVRVGSAQNRLECRRDLPRRRSPS
ncbi:UPF0280 family protein [Roseovarius sp. LXJ103]|uniref:UPF0280 family protein n=1 Tax=Roseovarius carneus TaxID=2853164 RepID=UPI000D60EFFE|nr:UPF0280 family protein [Roseovarius carneus]MBZ8117031.1 UPF0280 family protein [Roseovarius carneus]PWE37117.1 hypothetical protein DD563_14870 [Pelagicola sp. LXJ1103]